jgi:hypothetical protein
MNNSRKPAYVRRPVDHCIDAIAEAAIANPPRPGWSRTVRLEHNPGCGRERGAPCDCSPRCEVVNWRGGEPAHLRRPGVGLVEIRGNRKSRPFALTSGTSSPRKGRPYEDQNRPLEPPRFAATVADETGTCSQELL